MQSTKNIIKGMLFASFVLAFLFIPKAFAGPYDCDLIYPGADSVQPSFTYDGCCYPQGTDKEPYQGISCRPENQILMLSPTRCVSKTDILSLATQARGLWRKSFNCKDGSISGDCRDGYCMNSGGTCESRTGVACNAALNRNDICPGGCGSCKSGYVYCGTEQFHDELSAGTLSCQAMDFGPATGIQADGAAGTCSTLGKEVANYCTGECTGCPAGKTRSGVTPGMCVPYGERFIEIFDYGFTYFGGKLLNLGEVSINNAYSYGSLRDIPTSKKPNEANFYGDVFVEVDQADNLNWSSLTVPAVIQSMIVNAGYQFCGPGGSCPVSDQICTAGICNNPTTSGEVDDSCTNSSSCNLGLLCDMKPVSPKCYNPASPGNELLACTNTTPDCAAEAGTTCVAGYCRNQDHGIGSACNGDDTDCAAGLICNASNICVLASDTTSRFVGLTGTAVNGGQTDYKNADKLCSDAYDGGHVCWSKEIVASYLANVPTIIAPNGVTTGFAWINAAAPGNQFPLVNDCNGWNMSTPDSDIYGTIWNFNGKNAGIAPCEMPFKFACCK